MAGLVFALAVHNRAFYGAFYRLLAVDPYVTEAARRGIQREIKRMELPRVVDGCLVR